MKEDIGFKFTCSKCGSTDVAFYHHIRYEYDDGQQRKYNKYEIKCNNCKHDKYLW